MRLMTIAAVSLFLVLGGCATNGGGMKEAGDVTKDAVDAMIKAAEEANTQAASSGGLWRDADKMIKQAKGAASKGELEKAMKLAKTAKFQGEMGAQQAADQANAKPWLF